MGSLSLKITLFVGLLRFILVNPCFSAELAKGGNFSFAKEYAQRISSYPKPVVFSKLLSQIVLPAQKVESLDPTIDSEFFRKYGLKGDWHIKKFFLATPDNAMLETIDIRPPNFDISESKFIIAFNGNGMTYPAYLYHLTTYSKALGAATIGFNYRGVGKSSSHPRNFHELILDGIAQIERILDFGVKPENITIDGHSLGGAIGAYVAGFFYAQGIKVKFFSDRSFSSLDEVINTKYPIFLGGALIPFLPKVGWNLRPIDEFNSIDNAYKAYVYSTDDEVIDVSASLAYSLNENDRYLGKAATGGGGISSKKIG